MASFGKLLLTSAGLQAQILAQGGKKLEFSKIKMGDGAPPTGSISTLTDLISPKITLTVTNGYRRGEAFVVESYFSNESLVTGFYWKEVGLFIKDSNGADVLYAYAYAGSNYDFIPATTDERYAKYIRIATVVSNAQNISITESTGILYVDVLTFKDSISHKAIATGTGLAMTASIDAEIKDGTMAMVKIPANLENNATLAMNNGVAVPIKTVDGKAVTKGAIKGTWLSLIYSDNAWYMVSGGGGGAEMATEQEALAGTVANKAMSPLTTKKVIDKAVGDINLVLDKINGVAI